MRAAGRRRLLAACGDDAGEPEGAAEEPAGAEAEESGTVLHDWVDCMRGEGLDLPDPTRDDRAAHEARRQGFADCMADHGIDFVPDDVPDGPSPDSPGLDPATLDAVEACQSQERVTPD